MSRGRIGSGKGVGVDLIVGKEGNSGSAHSFVDGRVGLLFILTTTDGGDAVCRKSEPFIEKSSFPIIAAVVVSDRDKVKASYEQALIGTRVASKGIRLRNRSTLSRNDTLQVADSEIETV